MSTEENNTYKLLTQILRENLAINRENNDELIKASDHAKAIAESAGFTKEQRREILKSSRDIARLNSKLAAAEEDRLNASRSTKDINKDLLKGKDQLLRVDNERKELQEQIRIATKSGNFEAADALRTVFRGTKAQRDMAKDNINALDKELLVRTQIEKKLGISGNLIKGISKIPLVGQFLDSSKALSAMEVAAKKTDKHGNNIATKTSVMAAGFKEVGKQIYEGMTDPLFVLAALIKSGFKFDKSVTNFARDFGLSTSDAKELRRDMTEIANDSGRFSINSTDTSKAMADVAAQFGTTGDVLKSDIIEEMAVLGKLTNMSAESQGNFARFANISGKSARTITLETRRAVVNAEQERGLRLDINKTLDEAGKINGQIAAQLGGNVTKISSAVAVAKQFGMTLEGVAKAGASLLNFETSIGNELEAELLIGKQINLEKARLAALTGDYETLTKEINANIGDFGDFTKLNVIQQQALAKSVGMTADELSDVLLKNENIDQLAKEARLAGDEDLAKQLEKRAAQEKFNDAVDKMKALFVDIVGGPVGELLSMLATGLGYISSIGAALGLGENKLLNWVVTGMILVKTFKMLRNTFVASKALLGGMNFRMKRQLVLARQNLVTEKGTNVQRSLGIRHALRHLALGAANLAKSVANLAAKAAAVVIANPIYGALAVAGGIAAGAMITGAFSKGDDMIDNQHTGKKAYFDEGDITVLNDNDKGTFVATTNDAKTINSGGGGTTDMSETVSALKELVTINQKQLNKSPVEVKSFAQNFPVENQMEYTSYT